MDAADQANLEQQIATLAARVLQLEETISEMRTTDRFTLAAPTFTNASTSEVTVEAMTAGLNSIQEPLLPTGAERHHGTPNSSKPDSQESEPRPSLESRIGSQFFSRIGIFALLIGTAWFLKLAFDSHWIGPLGRILIGLGAGAALVLWSERFRGQGYPAFAYSLKAVGSGVLYLSLWAAYSVFHLVPAGAAFAAMVAVTAWNGYMAWRQDAELLAFYAIVGGFITPLLLSTGENKEMTLFSYVLVLDTAALTLVAVRPWARLLLGAFLGTLFLSLGWYFSFYSDSQFAPTSSFAAIFFVLFAIAPMLMRGRTGIEGAKPIKLVVLPIGTQRSVSSSFTLF